MRNKALKLTIFLVYLLGAIYLVLPEPSVPGLPDSFKSTEPGDTVEIAGVSAYYTNLSRREVIDFYRKNLSWSPFLKIPLITYTLNHPPEYARETIRDTLHSNFYEELVHPLRISLFINGWTLSEDLAYQKEAKDGKKPTLDFFIDGKNYKTKITLYYVSSLLWGRILIWTGSLVVFLLLVRLLSNIIFALWPGKK